MDFMDILKSAAASYLPELIALGATVALGFVGTRLKKAGAAFKEIQELVAKVQSAGADKKYTADEVKGIMKEIQDVVAVFKKQP